MTYDPHNWFWIIAGDETRAWSSAARGYVDIAQADPDRDGSAVRMTYDPHNWFWIIAGDETRAWSSAARGYVDIAQADPDRITRIDSMDSLKQVLRAANVPPYHAVSPYRIVRRLEAAGIAAQALAVIDAPGNAVLKARFYTLAGAGGIPADDPDAIKLVLAAGGDPDVILAPE